MCLGDKLCQRKISLLALFAFCCSFLLSFLLPCTTVNALEVGSSYNLTLKIDGSFATIPGDSPVVPALDGYGGLVYNFPWNRQITRLGFGLNNSPTGTPGLSGHPHLITFTMDFDFPSTMTPYYHSPSWDNMVTIFDSCYGSVNTSFPNAFSCTYTLLTSSATDQIITTDGNVIFNTIPTSSPPASSYVSLLVSPVRVVSLYGGVSSGDLETLSNNISDSFDNLEATVSSSSVTPAQIQTAVVAAIEQSGVTDSIDSIEQGNQDRYEEEKQERQDKEDELNESVEDLSLSASVVQNPFTSLFWNMSSYRCYTTSYLHGFFNAQPFTVCPPYPQQYYSIIRVCGTMFIFALLVRVYYKILKGGFNG